MLSSGHARWVRPTPRHGAGPVVTTDQRPFGPFRVHAMRPAASPPRQYRSSPGRWNHHVRDTHPPEGWHMTELDLELSRVVSAHAALRHSRRTAMTTSATFVAAVMLLVVALVAVLAH